MSPAGNFVEPTLMQVQEQDISVTWWFSMNGKPCRPVQSTGRFVYWWLAVEDGDVKTPIDSGMIGLN